MSSQAIATSTRGLPDFSSHPLDLPDFPDPTWSDRSNPHDEAAEPKPQDEPPQTNLAQSPGAEHPSWSEMDTQQRSQAVGNLLAALAPISPTQTATATADADANADANVNQGSPTNKTEATFKPTDENDPIDVPAATEATNDNINADPSISLPPLPPLSNDEFLDANPQSTFSPPLPEPPTDPTPANQGPATLMPSVSQMESQTPAASPGPLPERREIEAFAKIEFEDGNYYITTYACELGRDAFAYRAALARAEEARQAEQDRTQSSSGRRSEGMPKPNDSQVQGSVVSEAGGFGGVDDGPVLQDGDRRNPDPLHSQSSDRSAGSVVKPQEVLINPPLIPFDYHKMAERQAQFEHENEPEADNEQPAPVTADHIPDAHNCPLIPIHAMRTSQKSEVENHRSISRRHVKIQWDFDKDCFSMKVLGRNGAFLDDQYLPRGGVKRLRDGSKIQISNVWMTFRLPNQRSEPISEDSERDRMEETPSAQRNTSPTPNEEDEDEDASLSPSRSGKTRTRIVLNTSQQPSPSIADPLIGPDGQPMPPRKRGPGRPPKDGIMSTRERREREKAQRLAEAKAANGGKTPPPMLKGKFPKPIVKEEVIIPDMRTEKRKYKKRKRPGEDGDIVQSIEGGEVDVPSETEKAPVKKARQSKSPSPDYPPAESLTEEQLARPSEPYARLIYDILIDIHPKALPLKQIYRALKLKFPFFVHRVDSEGWQSSVRHNLNQEWNKLFEKGEKEGKGFAWKAIPGALQPQAERRRAAQQAAANKPKPPPAPRQPPPPGSHPPLNWQNTPFPQQNGMPPRGPPPFFVQGPHGPMPPPPNGMPWPPPPPPPGGIPSSASPNPNGHVPPHMQPGQNPPPQFFPPPQGGRPPFPPQPPVQPGGASQPNAATAQGPPRPNSAAATPVPPPPIPSSSSASRNMPCSTDGLLAIRRFENAMYDQVRDPAKIEEWQKVFASVKRRLLHGAPHSSLPNGETKEELTIMEHVRRFIDRFKNPNFVGFSIEQTRGTGSPAPTTATSGAVQSAEPSSAQPSQSATAPVPTQAVSSAKPVAVETTKEAPKDAVPQPPPTIDTIIGGEVKNGADNGDKNGGAEQLKAPVDVQPKIEANNERSKVLTDKPSVNGAA
ncbi:hypothetical protein A1O1_06197 [Capronia coronata CBS 617.96]|uniref:Fork-head domain-containing protein n=1 Tax=Capronia coronata CBS 617.96 TaxID=1182541 RepID=W9Y041_9EURO|nr:uncharacterized protein A1O1_06197 [Capronia coronata CBS 617.96]EXJ85828.1 hypothetical protein A1O1_06197 [Capronia coronata CBS 617.96]